MEANQSLCLFLIYISTLVNLSLTLPFAQFSWSIKLCLKKAPLGRATVSPVTEPVERLPQVILGIALAVLVATFVIVFSLGRVFIPEF